MRSPRGFDRRDFLSLSGNAAGLLLCQPASAWAKPAAATGLTNLTLHAAGNLVREREISPVELTQACLARIEEHDSRINAFITLRQRQALQQAQAAEREIAQGRWRGPLHGIPIALKDNIDTAGLRTTAASAVFIDRIPATDADVVRRLVEAGAVVLGKLNMNEFAVGADGVSSYWGPVHNPRSSEYESGGSSSGSAAAVAAGFCFGTLGTDTGGSIRIPASLCGVVGLKPTYGLVSNAGVIPLADSLDHVGPLGKTALDAALMLQSIAGHDPQWAGSARVDAVDYVASVLEDFEPPRLGIPSAYFYDGLDPQVAQVFDAALNTIRGMAASTVDDVRVPHHLDIFPALVGAELGAYHAALFATNAGMYQLPLRKMLTKVLGQEATRGADYVNACRSLREVRKDAGRIFTAEFDLLVMPTLKHRPMTIDARREWLQSTESLGPDLRNTTPFNVLGLPAISIPCGYTAGGLPVGLQIVARPFAESRILSFALERVLISPRSERNT